jgi:hypothetical protein
MTEPEPRLVQRDAEREAEAVQEALAPALTKGYEASQSGYQD